MRIFYDRSDAGRQLAGVLADFDHAEDSIVLALSKSGASVAQEVARGLSLPLDMWMVARLHAPGQEEISMGAVSIGGSKYLSDNVIRSFGVSAEEAGREIERQMENLRRMNDIYRGGRDAAQVRGKNVIVVDDGLASDTVMRVAITSLRAGGARRVTVAVPVAAAAACSALVLLADEIVCLYKPQPFYGVAQWYMDFPQLDDGALRDIFNPASDTGRGGMPAGRWPADAGDDITGVGETWPLDR